MEIQKSTLTEITDIKKMDDIYKKCMDEPFDLLHRAVKVLNNYNKVYSIDIEVDKSIGIVAIYNINFEDNNAFVDGFIIDKSYEVELRRHLIEIMKIGFVELSLHKLNVKYVEENYFNEYIWNCLRFVHEGTMRDMVLLDKKYYNIGMKSIIAHEYARSFLNESKIHNMIYQK